MLEVIIHFQCNHAYFGNYYFIKKKPERPIISIPFVFNIV